MNITLVCDCKIPVSSYDDRARALHWLGKELAQLGHRVTFMAQKGSSCEFADMQPYREKVPLDDQLPPDTDLVHFHGEVEPECSRPFLITLYDNVLKPRSFHPNTVFLSHGHAQLHGASVFVYPGVDFSEYAVPELEAKRIWYHFLGNASKRGRNVRGAIDLAARMDARLHVIGGTRVNFRQGLSIPLSPTARFHGALSPGGRDALLNASKGMIFPVLWPEPFSMGVVESLYFGCPVFGTPYGALPELLGKKVVLHKRHSHRSGKVDAFYSDYGCLSTKKAELLEAMKNPGDFDREKCHEYARTHFSSRRMAQDYLRLYEQVLQGHALHDAAPVMTENWNEQLFDLD